MDVDVKVAVELDDALVGTGLFLNRRFGNGEFVLDADVAVLLVLLLVAREALHDFGLADHLLRKVVQRKTVLLLEVFHRLVEHLGLIGFRHLEFVREMLGHVLLAHGHRVVGIVVVILTLAHVQEIVDPIACFGAVGVVHDADRETRFALGVENDAPLVQLIDVDPLMRGDMQPRRLLLDVEERVARLGLEQPDGIDRLASETAVGEVDDIEFPALDLGVHAGFIEMSGKADRMVVKRFGVVEDPAGEIPDLVAGQVGVVVEVEILLGLETAHEIGQQRLHQGRVGELVGERRRDHQRLVFCFVAHDMHGQRADPGFFGIEHFRYCLRKTEGKDGDFSGTGQAKNRVFSRNALPDSR